MPSQRFLGASDVAMYPDADDEAPSAGESTSLHQSLPHDMNAHDLHSFMRGYNKDRFHTLAPVTPPERRGCRNCSCAGAVPSTSGVPARDAGDCPDMLSDYDLAAGYSGAAPGWAFIDFITARRCRSFPTSWEVGAYRRASGKLWRVTVATDCGTAAERGTLKRYIWTALTLLAENSDLFSTASRVCTFPLAECMRDLLQRSGSYSGTAVTINVVSNGDWTARQCTRGENAQICLNCCGTENFFGLIRAGGVARSSTYQCGVVWLACTIFHELIHFLGPLHFTAFGPFTEEDVTSHCDCVYTAEMDAFWWITYALGLQFGTYCNVVALDAYVPAYFYGSAGAQWPVFLETVQVFDTGVACPASPTACSSC